MILHWLGVKKLTLDPWRIKDAGVEPDVSISVLSLSDLTLLLYFQTHRLRVLCLNKQVHKETCTENLVSS